MLSIGVKNILKLKQKSLKKNWTKKNIKKEAIKDDQNIVLKPKKGLILIILKQQK